MIVARVLVGASAHVHAQACECVRLQGRARRSHPGISQATSAPPCAHGGARAMERLVPGDIRASEGESDVCYGNVAFPGSGRPQLTTTCLA